MASSAAVGRPKIEGLSTFNLRILQEQRDALERIVVAERKARSHPSLTVTDLIREYIGRGIEAHDANLDAIAVHDGAHFLGREIETDLTIIRLNKAVTVPMALHLTNDFTHETHRKLLSTCHGLNFDARIAFFAVETRFN